MKQRIIERVNRFFNGVDRRDWETCEEIMAEQVLLDYTSMAGGEPALLAKKQIIDSWKGLLPGFDSTHHQLGNAVVDLKGEDAADYLSYVTASHFIAGEEEELWTVVGSYEIGMTKDGERWVIGSLKLNFKFQFGNENLPAAAKERL